MTSLLLALGVAALVLPLDPMAVPSQAPGLAQAAAPSPGDLFAGFPAVHLGQGFEAARAALEAAGARPATFGSTRTELAWDGRFGDHQGRATLLVAPGAGVRQISVLLQARGDGDELFRRLEQRITARRGSPAARDRSPLDRTLTWAPSAGTLLSLRQTLDPAAPVVVLSWIRG